MTSNFKLQAHTMSFKAFEDFFYAVDKQAYIDFMAHEVERACAEAPCRWNATMMKQVLTYCVNTSAVGTLSLIEAFCRANDEYHWDVVFSSYLAVRNIRDKQNGLFQIEISR